MPFWEWLHSPKVRSKTLALKKAENATTTLLSWNDDVVVLTQAPSALLLASKIPNHLFDGIFA